MQATLTARQARFVTEFLLDQNPGAAAGRAGYTAANLAAQASELLAHPAIAERVQAGMQAALAQIRHAALALMQQRMRAAFFDPGKLFARGWDLLPIEALADETRATLELRTVRRKSGPVLHARQPDRHKALRALEKAHEKLEQLNEKHYAQLEKEGRARTLD